MPTLEELTAKLAASKKAYKDNLPLFADQIAHNRNLRAAYRADAKAYNDFYVSDTAARKQAKLAEAEKAKAEKEAAKAAKAQAKIAASTTEAPATKEPTTEAPAAKAPAPVENKQPAQKGNGNHNPNRQHAQVAR